MDVSIMVTCVCGTGDFSGSIQYAIGYVWLDVSDWRRAECNGESLIPGASSIP